MHHPSQSAIAKRGLGVCGRGIGHHRRQAVVSCRRTLLLPLFVPTVLEKVNLDPDEWRAYAAFCLAVSFETVLPYT
jgi:hypothetical protein